ALGDLLAALTRILDRRTDVPLMRGAFEAMLARVVPVRAVHLRDANGRWGRSEATAVESIALEVPGGGPATQPILEATFDAGCRLGEWDFQMLGLATHIAGLVLEIERSHAQLAKAGLLTAARAKRDGAAPLIGSTPAMHTLRDTI